MFVMVPNNKRQMKYNTITHLNIQNVCGVLTFSPCVCVRYSLLGEKNYWKI